MNRRRHLSSDPNADHTLRNIALLFAGAVLLIFSLIGLFSSFTIVEADEACVTKRQGDIRGIRDSGLHLKAPFGIDKFACYSTTSLVYETVDEDGSESKADYVDVAVDGVSVDGQPIMVTYTVRFKFNENDLENVHGNVGKTESLVTERVVKFHSRTVVRQVVNTYSAEDLYLGGLEPISNEIEEKLRPLFDASGVTLEYFEIKRPSFTEEYENAIEAKQLAIEEADKETNLLEVEKQKAEKNKTTAEGQAAVKQINAEAEAKANTTIAESVTPELLELRRIEALQTIQWALIPSESMPIVQMPTETPTATETPQG